MLLPPSSTPHRVISREQCPLCVGKGYAYHLFGVHESRGSESEGHHHHHHHHTAHDQHPGDRCSRRIEDGTSGFWAGAGVTGTAEGGTPPVPGYTHAVNTTCKVKYYTDNTTRNTSSRDHSRPQGKAWRLYVINMSKEVPYSPARR